MSFDEGRWASLTRCLDEATHPVRVAIDGLLGGDVTGLQADYRNAHGPLLVTGSGANPGTIGGAFDQAVRFLIEPAPSLAMARRAAGHLSGRAADPGAGGPVRDPIVALVDQLGSRLDLPVADHARRPANVAVVSPMQVPERDGETLIRASWALTLFTEIFRAGPDPPAH